MEKAIVLVACLFFITQSHRAQDILDAAQAQYAQGLYEESYAMVNELAEAKPTAEAVHLRANCLHKMGEFSEALEDYNRAKTLGFMDDILYLNRGICKTNLGYYDDAKLDLINYMNDHIEDPKPYYWMGAVEYLTADNKASLRYLNEVIYLDSAYADAYFLRGAIYADMNKTLAAYEDFKQAYELNPALLQAKMNMGALLIELGNYQQAIETLSEVKLENIDFVAEVLYYRGHAFFNLHDLDGACNDWVEAAQLGDVDAEASYKRACRDKSGAPRLKKRNYVQF